MSNIYALDIETTGLDNLNDRLLCIGVWSPKESRVFETIEDFRAWNKPSHEYIMQNGSFDTNWLKRLGVNLEKQWKYDTRSIASILTPAPHAVEKGRRPLSLENMVMLYLSADDYKLDRGRMEDYSRQELHNYCLKDCEYTYKLLELFVDKLDPVAWKFVQSWLMPVTRLIAQMEYNGIYIDKPGLERFKKELEQQQQQILENLLTQTEKARKAYKDKEIRELKDKYDKMCKAQLDKGRDPTKTTARYASLFEEAVKKLEPFNFNSSSQLIWMLRDYYNLNLNRRKQVLRKGRKVYEEGDWADVTALKSLDHPVARSLLEFRRVEKLLTSSVPNLLDNISSDGYIHPHYHIGGTRTGRLSSSNPNTQQIPRGRIRSYVKTDSDNTILLTIDYAQIEIRTLAHGANEEALIVPLQHGHDPYTIVAKLFFPENIPDEITNSKEEAEGRYKKYRDVAKTLGLSIIYGTGAKKAQEVIKNELGIAMNIQDVRKRIEAYRDSMPNVKAFKHNLEKKALNRGILHNLLGRPFQIEDNSKIYMNTLNTWNQGTASDLNLYAHACHAAPNLDRRGIYYKYRLPVHDEVVLELRADEADQVTREIIIPSITRQTEESLGFQVPLEVEWGLSRQWEKP